MICPKCSKELPADGILFCPYCGKKLSAPQKKKATKRPNGQGSVYLENGKWTACVPAGYRLYSEGNVKLVRKSKRGFASKTAALEYLEQLREKKIDVHNLHYYWKLFESSELEHLSDSKRTAYKIAYGKLADIVMKPVSELTVAHLRAVVMAKAPTYYPARDMKVLLNHLFKLAAADGEVNKDLPSLIVLPKLEEKETVAFSREEQAALWSLYESGDSRAAIPLIMIYTGMMPGELQRLTVDMIDFDNSQIVGVGIKTKERKKTPVTIPDVIVPVLRDMSAGKDKYLLKRNEDTFYKDYYAALEAAGTRRLSPYSCRHTTATALAVDELVAPQSVRKIMRWSSTKMLDRYAHPDMTDALSAANHLKKPQ